MVRWYAASIVFCMTQQVSCGCYIYNIGQYLLHMKYFKDIDALYNTNVFTFDVTENHYLLQTLLYISILNNIDLYAHNNFAAHLRVNQLM